MVKAGRAQGAAAGSAAAPAAGSGETDEQKVRRALATYAKGQREK